MNLQSSDSSKGSAAWFAPLWRILLPDDEEKFELHIEQSLGLSEGDFCGDVRAGSECVVIFYIVSILEPLVHRSFDDIKRPSVNEYPNIYSTWQRALDVLHNPSSDDDKYRIFQCFAYDDECEHGGQSLTTSTKFSALSSLLTQLQDFNNSDS